MSGGSTEESGSFALALSGVPFAKLLRLVNHDGPLEGTGGDQEGSKVEQVRDDEAPSRAREPTRTPRDERGFHNGDHARSLRQIGYPGKVSGKCVAVGRCKHKGPDPGAGRDVHDLQQVYREPTQLGGLTRALYNYGDEGWGKRRDSSSPLQAAFERHFLAWGHRSSQRRCQEHRCDLQTKDGFDGVFHSSSAFVFCFW